jgi:hypothetical protein
MLLTITEAGNLALGVNDDRSGEVLGKFNWSFAFERVRKGDEKSFLVVQFTAADLAGTEVPLKREFNFRGEFSIDVSGDLFGGAIENKLGRRILHVLLVCLKVLMESRFP